MFEIGDIVVRKIDGQIGTVARIWEDGSINVKYVLKPALLSYDCRVLVKDYSKRVYRDGLFKKVTPDEKKSS